MSKKLTIAIIGLGSRGMHTYAPAIERYADRAEIVAAADLRPANLKEFSERFHVPANRCFTSAEELLAQEKLADAVFICSQDRDHVPHGLLALEKGYHVLMEKPISPNPEDCRKLLESANRNNRRVVVCHVLRYTPFYRKLKELISSGTIGEVVTLQALENVGYWHQAHSFVRGNWRRSDETSPMCLAKTCHDYDMYLWLADKKPALITSFGNTYHFKSECAPAGAAKRCLDGCAAKENCPFDAEKIYITSEKTGVRHGNTGWPADVLALIPDEENIREALEKGPYGRCVYYCDNDVVDHQVTSILNTDGSTINFTMSGFSAADASRCCKVMGTKGELIGDMRKNTIEVVVYGQEREVIDVSKLSDDFSGHSGGDIRLVDAFLTLLETGKETDGITTLEQSLDSHYVAFAAEESRLAGGMPVSISKYS